MNEIESLSPCRSPRVGFGCVASLATVALTAGAFAQGGDNPTSATVIPGLPYADAGTTVGYTDDSDEVCPYTGSTSPDVWYSYTPSSNQQITVDLCDSGYDTKVYVYDSSLALVDTRPAGAPACNDDFCSSPGGGPFRSFLACVNVTAGATHYIVIDGWLGSLGSYQMDVSVTPADQCGPCIVECPAGANLEPDDCQYGNPAPNDQVNGGCNATPPAFTTIVCDKLYCGTGYFDGSFRDTDWWRLQPLGASATFTMKGRSEFDSVYGRVQNNGVDSCAGVSSFAEFVVLPNCVDANLVTARLNPGVYWFFVGPQFTDLVNCNQPAGGPPAEIGENYTLEVNCELNNPPCPWDFNGDGVVGFADLLKVLSEWGPCPQIPEECPPVPLCVPRVPFGDCDAPRPDICWYTILIKNAGGGVKAAECDCFLLGRGGQPEDCHLVFTPPRTVRCEGVCPAPLVCRLVVTFPGGGQIMPPSSWDINGDPVGTTYRCLCLP